MILAARQPLTRQRVEHALQLLAGIVAESSEERAALLAPIYDRLERELAAMDDIVRRARERLAKIPPVPHQVRPQRSKQTDRMLVVYFVQAGDFVKIGKSTDWQDRLLALQTGSPHPVIPLLVLPATRHTERRLHVQFHRHRMNGEWFHLSAEIIAYIEAHRAEDLQGRPGT